MKLDETTSDLLRTVTEPGQASRYVHAAVVEKIARDQMRGELDALRRRIEAVERALEIRNEG